MSNCFQFAEGIVRRKMKKMKTINFIVKNIIVFGLILFCSCNKNGSEPKDCLGVEGGGAVVDQCGVCEGNGSTCTDCMNIDNESGCCPGYSYSNNTELCTPDQFLFNSSVNQGAYFFEEVVLGGEMINSNDWVGAFTPDGSICVGARKWDTSECGGGVCEVPVLGIDEENPNYMNAGQIPVFKIFKASDLSLHGAVASECTFDIKISDEPEIPCDGNGSWIVKNEPWYAFYTPLIDCLSETVNGCSDEDKK